MHEFHEFLTPDQMQIFCHSVRKQDWAKTRVQSELKYISHLAQIKEIRSFLSEKVILLSESNFLIVFLVGVDKVTPTLLLVRIVVVLLLPAGGICTLQEKELEFRPKRSSSLSRRAAKIFT